MPISRKMIRILMPTIYKVFPVRYVPLWPKRYVFDAWTLAGVIWTPLYIYMAIQCPVWRRTGCWLDGDWSECPDNGCRFSENDRADRGESAWAWKSIRLLITREYLPCIRLIRCVLRLSRGCWKSYHGWVLLHCRMDMCQASRGRGKGARNSSRGLGEWLLHDRDLWAVAANWFRQSKDDFDEFIESLTHWIREGGQIEVSFGRCHITTMIPVVLPGTWGMII